MITHLKLFAKQRMWLVVLFNDDDYVDADDDRKCKLLFIFIVKIILVSIRDKNKLN